MNTIFVPAWLYRARAIVQRTWGWSPIEEMVMLALDRTPGTIREISATLQVPVQVVSSTAARLMQFGVVEVRLSPRPVLATSSVGHNFILNGRALPERTEDREVGISLVYERVGHSLLRRVNVKIVPVQLVKPTDKVVAFSNAEPPETEDSMLRRASQFMAGKLRSGEWLRGIQSVRSVLERKYLEIDLDEVKEGTLPDGASEELAQALLKTIKTGVLPKTRVVQPAPPLTIETTFDACGFIIGAEEHLKHFEAVVGAAKADVFVLSTFVAGQDDDQGKANRERIFRALEDACSRGVRCHLFFGTSLERSQHAIAMAELAARLSAVKRTRGFVLAQRDSVGSHAKFLAADDGHGGAVVSLGSCNWLSSPFSAVEVSAELRESLAAAQGLDLLRSIVFSLASAKRSAETLQFMASELRRSRRPLVSPPSAHHARARLTLVEADEHERLLRRAAHEATSRFICCTNKVGGNMVPALFNPAEVAGRRLNDVRVYYSRQTGPTKRRHVAAQKERLHGVVDLIGVKEPQVHAKFLLWDEDHAVVSTMNWGSQSGLADKPLDELGFYFEGPGLAMALLKRFESCCNRNDSPAYGARQ